MSIGTPDPRLAPPPNWGELTIGLALVVLGTAGWFALVLFHSYRVAVLYWALPNIMLTGIMFRFVYTGLLAKLEGE